MTSSRIPKPGPGFLYGLYQNRLRRSLDPASVPQHVAMIIDGNRRWARQLGLETVAHGHRAGAAKMLEFLTWCDELGVKVVTLYLLSADNLSNRDRSELADLIEIIADLAHAVSAAGDWRVQHVGTTAGLPKRLVQALGDAEQSTKENPGMHVNLAVGYGGRKEIVMLVPVVFFVLPVTVVFAVFPGLFALQLAAP